MGFPLQIHVVNYTALLANQVRQCSTGVWSELFDHGPSDRTWALVPFLPGIGYSYRLLRELGLWKLRQGPLTQ